MIDFSGARGSLFARLGKLGLLVTNLGSYQATQYTAMTDPTNGVVGELDDDPDIQAIMGSNYLTVLSGTDNTIGAVVPQIAAACVNRAVFRDNPQLGQTLTSGSVLTSLREIIRQMRLAGASVLAATITATPGPFVGTGNGQVNVSVKRPVDGLTMENAFAENLTFTCVQDSYLGGTTAGNETLSCTGAGSEVDYFSFDWPLGSNSSVSLSAIDGSKNNRSGNLLTNSGFDAWTGQLPDSWDLQVGTAGTNISEETGNIYDPTTGGSALKIIGDSAGTLTTLRQQFSSASGTTGQLRPLTQYSVCLFLRRASVAAAAGQLTVELVDSGGTQVQDSASAVNSFDVSLVGLSTNYAAFTGTFRTPLVLPSSVYIRLRLSTALTDGTSVYLDKMSMGTMTQTYASGPFVAVHSGSFPFVQGDYAICPITNSRGSGGTLNTWQTFMFRAFTIVGANGLLLPSSPTPTISDSLLQ